jgi:CubicO group peptidase (beta-lactamase class C family)
MAHRPRRRIVLIFVALLSLAAVAYAVQSTPASTPRRQNPAIDKVLADAVARGDVPGVVAMAVDRRGVIYQGAFGLADTSTGRRLEIDALFRIASMTKAVTSVAAMQLVEAGRLQLDDPADKYLPELAKLSMFEAFDSKTGAYKVKPATQPLTVRHLLTHTSGLGYNFTSPILRDFKPREGEKFTAGPLLFEPGEQWMYGTSTDWVGRLVERFSGKGLEGYFQQRIFGPLAMMDTSYNVPAGRRGRLVPVHRRQADGKFAPDAVQPSVTVPRPSGGGGLASTAADYTKFLQMLLNGGTLNGARVLRADTVDLMGRNQIGNLSVPALKTAMPERSSDFSFVADGRDKWGLGFLISVDGQPGKRSPGSLSWGGINNTYFWIDPTRGIAGVILMQLLPFADEKALAVYDAFERAVYRSAGANSPGA